MQKNKHMVDCFLFLIDIAQTGTYQKLTFIQHADTALLNNSYVKDW